MKHFAFKKQFQKILTLGKGGTLKLLHNFNHTISNIIGDEHLLNDSKKIKTNVSSLADYLPYRFYDSDNQIFINENTIGVIMETGSLFGANPKDIETISNLLRDNIEEGTTVQILNYASPRTGNLLEHYKHLRMNAKPEIQKITEQRVQFIKGANLYDFSNTENPFRIRDFRIFFVISIPMTEKGQHLISLVDKIKDFRSLDKREARKCSNLKLEAQIDTLNRMRINFTSLLQGIGIGSSNLNAQEFIRLLDEIVNSNALDVYRSEKVYNPIELLNKQIVNPSNEMEVGEEAISIFSKNLSKKVIAKCFSVKEYPKTFSQNEALNLIGDYESDLGQIPCTFLQTIVINFPKNAAKEKDKIRLLNIKYQKNKENPFFRFFPETAEKADEYAFVRNKLESGQRLVDIWNQVMIIGRPEVIDTASRNIIALYGRSGFNLCLDKYLSLQSFMGFLPFIAGEGLFKDLKTAKRTEKVLSWTVANIAPLQGEPKGNINNPCMLLFGRRGQPFFFHPFLAPAGGNFNTCIVGKSGSGKSFFMQDYMISIAGLGGRMIIVDDGQSFKKTCQFLGGKYIEFSEENNICLNPFTLLVVNQGSHLAPNFLENTSEDEKNNFYDEVVNFIKKLIKSIITPEDILCSKEEAELIGIAVDTAIQKKGSSATLLTVSEILLEEYEDTTKNTSRPKTITDLLYSISLKMNAFTQGEYSKYFLGKGNIEINNDFVVFELSHIKDKPDLQKIITLYASFLGFKEMYLGDRKQIKSFVVDEAWALLSGKEMAEFMESMARRARKYNGQLVIATQSIDDFYKSSATTAILQNSDYLCILAQKAESISTLERSGKVGDMSNHLKNTLLSIKTVKGQYSEVVIYAHGSYAVSRLIVDPFSAKLYSSDAKDFNQIESLMKGGRTLVQALEYASNGLDSNIIQDLYNE